MASISNADSIESSGLQYQNKISKKHKREKTLDSGLSRENSVFAIFSIFFLRQYYDDDAFEYQNNDGIT